jgi:oxygen-independent coproporphyrinogen-3 oxidase
MSYQACVQDAERLLKESYRKLPEEYFINKSANTYLFNNITKYIYSRPAMSEKEEGEKLLRHEIESCNTLTMYAGVPWCEKICSFCNFAFSTTQNSDVYRKYINVLLREIDLLNKLGLAERTVTSIYFGGGTPTVLDNSLFEEYLTSVLNKVCLAEKPSITCESTINTVDLDKLSIMRRVGVTRLSTGLQSLNDEVRTQARLLGSGAEALEKVVMCRDMFDMFNVDLIYGHPYQSLEAWFDTILRTAKLELPSITLYRLEVKDRTSNFNLYQRSNDSFADELLARQQYFMAKIVLTNLGYVENPLGWFIRKDKHSGSKSWQTHMKGWASTSPYLGVGQGAFTLSPGVYYENHQVNQTWQTSIENGRLPMRMLIPLDRKVAFMNRLIKVLRTAKEIDLSAIEQELSELDLEIPLRRTINQHHDWGLLKHDSNRFVLTVAGESLIHWMIDELLTVCG